MRNLLGLQSLDGRSVRYYDAFAAKGEGPVYTRTWENPNAPDASGSPGIRIDHILVGTPRAHPDATYSIEAASFAFTSRSTASGRATTSAWSRTSR
jgi:hypothetical protein